MKLSRKSSAAFIFAALVATVIPIAPARAAAIYNVELGEFLEGPLRR